MKAEAIDSVHALFERKADTGLKSLLADDIELRPPTYGKSWTGRELVARLLKFAASSFSDFRYTDILSQDAMAIMRFEALIEGIPISGVDLIRFADDGSISIFEIFVRPPQAALALRDAMGRHVRTDTEVAGWMGIGAS